MIMTKLCGRIRVWLVRRNDHGLVSKPENQGSCVVFHKPGGEVWSSADIQAVPNAGIMWQRVVTIWLWLTDASAQAMSRCQEWFLQVS